MSDVLDRLALLVERGKVDIKSVYPPDLKDQEGVDEVTINALQSGVSPDDILSKGMIIGMQRIGVKFRKNQVFVPDVLMSAKAMNAGMKHLKPYFQSGQVKRKGKFVIGTVAGDLHDIGKNLVAMMIEGAGWEVIDLGINVAKDKFIKSINDNPGCIVGLSALLTTTMPNMDDTVKAIKSASPATKVIVGGAPLTRDFADKIGADLYSPDPQGAVEYLNNLG